MDWEDNDVSCPSCGDHFPRINGVPYLLSEAGQLLDDVNQEDSQYQQDMFHKRTPVARIASFAAEVISSEYQPYRQMQSFIYAIPSEAVVVEFGSGNRRLLPHRINVDLFPFPNVDIVSDITATYFAKETIDYLILDTVLEHVPEPQSVVNEIYRVLKPGGKVICISPWIFPYHGYPRNYYNISMDGLEYLFRKFSKRKIEINAGPTAALTNLISEYFTLAIVGNKKGLQYTAFKGLSLLPIFLFKFLDRFWSRNGVGRRISSCLSLVAEK